MPPSCCTPSTPNRRRRPSPFQGPGSSPQISRTAGMALTRPVSAPIERPPGPRLPISRRDIAPRARPFRARGAVCRGRASPIPLSAEMLFASPLQPPFSGHISPGFSPRFCGQMKQVIARWNPAPIPGLPGTSRIFPEYGFSPDRPHRQTVRQISTGRNECGFSACFQGLLKEQIQCETRGHMRNPPHFRIRSLFLISGGSVRGPLTAPRRARAAHPNRRGAGD